MKSYLSIFTFLFIAVTYGQGSESFSTPNYGAKTPEAASFLKYGEYPVDLSTGVPDISIPLYTIEAKGMQIPLSLSYHASGIKVTQEASWVGLGWNLSFGAQIILSVRDGVDEGNGMIDQMPPDTSLDYYYSHPNDYISGPLVTEQWNKSRVKDVYYFSSPTANGQFYVRNYGTGDIVVFPPSAFKVEFPTSNEGLPGVKFKITDTLGNIYLFKTTETSVNQSPGQIFTQSDFNSAWYVDQIRTVANDTINFTYEDDGNLIEDNISHQIDFVRDITRCNCPLERTYFDGTKPIKEYLQTTATNSKKIREIAFDSGLSKIVFERENGREDLINGNSKLEMIRVLHRPSESIAFTTVKTFAFNYSYFNDNYSGTGFIHDAKRLKLESLVQLPSDETYAFNYSDIPLPLKNSFSQDYFGYYNGKNNSNLIPETLLTDPYPIIVGGADRSVEVMKNQAGILTEIHYPTKGWTKFNYETNRIWGTSIDNFVSSAGCTVQGTGAGNSDPVITPCPDEEYCCTNPPNCVVYNYSNFSTNEGGQEITVNLSISNNVEDDDTEIKYQYVRFKVFMNGQQIYDSGKKNLNQQTTGGFIMPVGSGYIVAEAWGEHVHGSIQFFYNNSETASNNNLGPGLRIASVENYNTDNTLISKKVYEYVLPDDASKSSAKWTSEFNYNYWSKTFRAYTQPGHCIPPQGSNAWIATYNYNKTTSLTSSSMMGMENNALTYEYVKEKDINVANMTTNGYTLYKFSHDYDWVLDISIRLNIPWKRGKLLEKTRYKDGLGTFLTKEVNTYAEDASRVAYISGFKWIQRASFEQWDEEADDYLGSVDEWFCDPPGEFYGIHSVFKYNFPVNWQYLQSTQVTENIFDSSNQLTGTVVTTKSFNYNNPTHLQLSSETITNSLGETSETKYFYPGDTEVSSEANVSGLIQKNILAPLKIQSFKAGNKLSERNTVFKNWGTTSAPLYMPELIQGAKGNSVLETRVRFVKVDPNNGNVQQLKQENGTDVSYIWGYNGVYPIAKIENAAYTSINSSLITAAQNASLGTDEDALRAALKAIRDSLPNSMVTSYTYQPLIGVSSVTDSKGDTTYYNYDNQGRLTTVRDHFQRVISENTYHYKP